MRVLTVAVLAIATIGASADELQLRLTTYQFDPLLGEPPAPAGLRAADPPAGCPGRLMT